MFLAFDNSQHWITVYHQRIHDKVPPLESRIMTKYLSPDCKLPDNPPSYRTFPVLMVVRILYSKMLMLVGR